MEGAIKMDLTMLHCPLWFRPLKPLIFQYQGRHLACAGCTVGVEECRKCDPSQAFKVRNTAMDVVASAARVKCPHDGCGAHVAYHDI